MEVPDVDKIRALVDGETTRLQELVRAGGGDGRLRWDGFELRIDPIRWLVVPETDANDATALELYTARRCHSNADRLADAIAEVVGGVDMPRTLWDFAAADFVTYFVVQPLVNPAFAPLLLLALDREMGHKRMATQLSDVVGRLAYDMGQPPAARDAEHRQVREAQFDYLCATTHCELDRDEWLGASDAAWAARCEEGRIATGAGPAWWSAIQRRIRKVAEAIYPDPRTEPAWRLTEGDSAEATYRLGPFRFTAPSAWPIRLGPVNPHELPPHVELEAELFGRGLYFQSPSLDYWKGLFANVAVQTLADDGGRPVHVLRGDLALGNVEWIDHGMLVAPVPSAAGFYEIVFRGPHALIASSLRRFRELVASLAPAEPEQLEARPAGRFGFAHYSFALPPGWRVEVGTREIRLPPPGPVAVVLRYLAPGPRDLRGLAIRQLRMLLADATVPIRVVIEPIGGRPIAIARATRGDERALVAIVGDWELVLRGPRDIVALHEPAFEKLVSSIESA